MTRFKTITALLVTGVSAPACGGAGEGLSPHYNPSLYSVNQPVVQRTDYVFDVASAGGVPLGERQRLGEWFSSLQLGYGDRVSIDESSAYPDPRARDDIAAIAARYGLLLSEGAPVTAGRIQSGMLRVIVSRSTASVPGCPMWNPQEVGARVTTSPNFGCATNSNLAQMIADPADLVLGRTGGSRDDPRVANKAIKTYRDTAPTGAGGLKQESSKGN